MEKEFEKRQQFYFDCIFKKGRLFQMVYLRQKSLIQVDGNTFK